MSQIKRVVVRSMEQLAELYNQYGNLPYSQSRDDQAAQDTKPEYIDFADGWLVTLPPPQLTEVLDKTFDIALMGFCSENVYSDDVDEEGEPYAGCQVARYTRREFWEFIAERGYIDHSSSFMITWYKPRCLVQRPPRIDYNYTKDSDPFKWDTNAVYSHVLGTSTHHFHDWVASTEWFQSQGIKHIIEPMAACAELCFFGQFSYPDLTYSMLDLDQSAIDKTNSLPWLDKSKMEYAYGDVLMQHTWDKLKLCTGTNKQGKSLCFIGKQSQNIFPPKMLLKLLKLCLANCDFVLMETMEYTESMFTDPAWQAAYTPDHLMHENCEVTLEIDAKGPNNRVTFESNLEVAIYRGNERKMFIQYPTWHCYTPSEIMHLAEGVLDVPREGMGFLDDWSSDYFTVDEYSDKPRTPGSLRRSNNGKTVGSVQTLCLARGGLKQ